jgi:hypothetical protein
MHVVDLYIVQCAEPEVLCESSKAEADVRFLGVLHAACSTVSH